MKILIITSAGMSSRFSASLGYECLKCIYYKDSFEESLLYGMLHQTAQFDRYVIVGGYKFDELAWAVRKYLPDYEDRIELVRNDQYDVYGSGYSLYMGLKAVFQYLKDHGEHADEIVFAEGDLFVDSAGFQRVYTSKKDVLTANREPILANKAVAYYFDADYGIHYIYDTGHQSLRIDEPFVGIFNSGQIWKFADIDRAKAAFDALTDRQWQGTNLEYIQKYFGALTKEAYEQVTFDRWINCNTVDDFNQWQGE